MSADKIEGKSGLGGKVGSGEYVYEQLRDEDGRLEQGCERWHKGMFTALRQADKRVWELVAGEYGRRRNSIQLLAAENECSKAVLAALGSVVQNKRCSAQVMQMFSRIRGHRRIRLLSQRFCKRARGY